MTPGDPVRPSALVELDDVGPGTRIRAFAHVMAGARVGAGCIVSDHTCVETGVVVGDPAGVVRWLEAS